MATDFSGFACPLVDLSAELLELVVVEHADQLVAKLLERHGATLDASAPGLADLFKGWLVRAHGSEFETAWNTAFGDVHAMLLSAEPQDVLRSAVALGLRLNACGLRGNWMAQLDAPVALRLGAWLLPPCQALEVRAGASRVALRLRQDGQWASLGFVRANGGLRSTDASAALLALRGRVQPGFDLLVVPGAALSEPCCARLAEAAVHRFERSDMQLVDSWLATCQQALQLLVDSSAHYALWVNRVLRELVPLRSSRAVFNSGSEAYSPGVVCVCDQPYRWPLAEMLVLECSQQYQYILNRLGPLDDGSDTRLYLSPFRNTERPLAQTVATYHAFGNVLLFYRQARKRGLVPDTEVLAEAFAHRERTLQAQLSLLVPVLAHSQALTPLGRALWEPLHQALEQEALAA